MPACCQSTLLSECKLDLQLCKTAMQTQSRAHHVLEASRSEKVRHIVFEPPAQRPPSRSSAQPQRNVHAPERRRPCGISVYCVTCPRDVMQPAQLGTTLSTSSCAPAVAHQPDTEHEQLRTSRCALL